MNFQAQELVHLFLIPNYIVPRAENYIYIYSNGFLLRLICYPVNRYIEENSNMSEFWSYFLVER